MPLFIPEDYTAKLAPETMEQAITYLKEIFPDMLARRLRLRRVTAPLFVLSGTGINDDLNGVERAVSFPIRDLGDRRAEVVHSLAKWKRMKLGTYKIAPGYGLYTDMNAIRADEELDNIHSLYVDQWDWERTMRPEERNLNFLKATVETIYEAMKAVEEEVYELYPHITPILPERITFLQAEELLQEFPALTPKEREQAAARKYGALFLIGIGGELSDGQRHDGRAPDYDDWSTPTEGGYKGLNGDIIVWNPVLESAFELSSMGIRVDAEALERLCRMSDAVTYEFENVPGDILIPLSEKYNIPQGYRPLYDSQDRVREKSNARDHGLRTPAFAAVDDEASLRAAVRELGLPAVLKTRTLGYDGHGQMVLRSEADIERALPLLSVPCILEEFIAFDSEASIVMVADRERVVSFPVGRNIHRDGILDLSIVPAAADAEVLERMKVQSERFMRDCGYEGILAIEYFIRGREIFFNEMAPRPHNSGHYTIEGCTTNQFRELVRYLVGEPLQEPRLVAPTVMKNILGQDLEAAREVEREHRPNVYVHIYGKTESRPKRKMGHITFVGMTGETYEKEWADRFVR